MSRVIAFMFPYIADKPRWPHKPDVQYHENSTVRQPSLLLAGLALARPEHVNLWRKTGPVSHR
jgi:hypothetical protein